MHEQIASARQSDRVAPARIGAAAGCRGNYRRWQMRLGLLLLLLAARAAPAVAATAPDLGTTSAFAVVASTFSNSNAATTVTGNICFTTGPGTAFTLNGTQTVPCSAQIGLDQAAALANINGQTCTNLGAGPITLDTLVVGLNPAGTIPPGCYFTAGAINITTLATVTLSGTGVYVFRAGGPLGIGASSAVNVTNGATAANVFWAPVAATTFGASASFVGTILDGAGITLGHLASLTGRALVFGGTVTADANSLALPPPAPPPGPVTIPTLSQWALGLLAGLLAIAGFAAMRRRTPSS